MATKYPSKTIKKDTTLGSAYITCIFDEERRLKSLIINLGKVGSDARAMSEALGRLATLYLEKGEIGKLKEELKNIGSDRSGVIPTLPHAISEVLEEL
jgi:hypothetical protein